MRSLLPTASVRRFLRLDLPHENRRRRLHRLIPAGRHVLASPALPARAARARARGLVLRIRLLAAVQPAQAVLRAGCDVRVELPAPAVRAVRPATALVLP